METRYLLDRGDWQGAAAMPMNSTGVPIADLLCRFTRGLGMARSSDLAARRQRLKRCGRCARRCDAPISPTGLTAPKSKCWRPPRGSQRRRARSTRRCGSCARPADGEDGSLNSFSRCGHDATTLPDELLEPKQNRQTLAWLWSGCQRELLNPEHHFRPVPHQIAVEEFEHGLLLRERRIAGDSSGDDHIATVVEG